MFARIAVVAAALAAVPSAFATDLADLSRDTGVSERHIRMVAGARTPYPEYLVAYDRVERRLKAALGENGYEHLARGEIAEAAQIHRERMATMARAEGAKARDESKAKEPREES